MKMSKWLVGLALGSMICGMWGCAAPETGEGSDAGVGSQGSGLPWRRLPAPGVAAERPLSVGFLIVDGVYNSELIAPYDILQHTRFHTDPALEVFTVSPDGKPVVTFEGLTISSHYSFETAPAIDILVVPSAEGSLDEDLKDERMISWVSEVGSKARFVLSLCDGAFVLAQAGLLDGLAVTTFPGDQDKFAERFPHLDLRRGPSFVHDDRAITSQGGAKSYDPAMYLVDHLYGEKVARRVGRGLIIDWPPRAVPMEGLVIPKESERDAID